MQIKLILKRKGSVENNLFWVFIACLSFFSCQQRVTKFDDSKVFRYNEHANITSLDPAFAKDQRNIWAVNQVFNGLVQLDDSLHIQPDIAKHWTISKDGKTYDFIKVPLRIDFILADKAFEVKSHKNYDEKLSDHYPVMASFSMRTE